MTDIHGSERVGIAKAPTGIHGLDEITGGGLPQGRPTLVCGSAGCGKTLLAMEFLVRGVTEHGEPGVFFSFEETARELAQNVLSLGFDLDALAARGQIAVEHVRVERDEFEASGEFDLEGLFIRLGLAIDTIGAKRVVLDTIETLFGGIDNEAVVRSELRRLFRWLKDKGVTAVITAERGEWTLTRQGLEEYVSDCVILLDHRVDDQTSIRRLRVVKYRGSAHGTNEYPFLIDASGLSVLPLTSLGLANQASNERVSTGIDRLDVMLGGGPFRGTSVLLSGTAGTGKSSIAAHFAEASCRRGERCLYYSFEESQSQILRNMRSIGLDLAPWVERGLLSFVSVRPTLYGLEMHLATMHKHICALDPSLVVIDPISNFVTAGSAREAHTMLLRLVDFLKTRQTTAVFVSLTSGGGAIEATDQNISSLIDTWILLRDIELGGERVLTAHGVEFRDVYVGPEGVLTGSMRLAQEARERAVAALRLQKIATKRRELEHKRQALAAQITALRTGFQIAEDELELLIATREAAGQQFIDDRSDMALSRNADTEGAPSAEIGADP
jgi:circadian clock protein KaiC